MWKNETEFKEWLAPSLQGDLVFAGCPRCEPVGKVNIFGINGNGERGSKRPFGYRILTGATVYPDIVGEIWIQRGRNYRRWDLFVEAVYKPSADSKFKALTGSFRQALQYKAIGGANEIFRRRPEHVMVLLTSPTYLTKPLQFGSQEYWFERFAWANGMGIIRRNPYTGRIMITLSEQEKYEVIP